MGMDMLSVSLDSRTRGHFCGYIQACNYQKNNLGLITVTFFGVPDAAIIDRCYADVTELRLDGEVIRPEDL